MAASGWERPTWCTPWETTRSRRTQLPRALPVERGVHQRLITRSSSKDAEFARGTARSATSSCSTTSVPRQQEADDGGVLPHLQRLHEAGKQIFVTATSCERDRGFEERPPLPFQWGSSPTSSAGSRDPVAILKKKAATTTSSSRRRGALPRTTSAATFASWRVRSSASLPSLPDKSSMTSIWRRTCSRRAGGASDKPDVSRSSRPSASRCK